MRNASSIFFRLFSTIYETAKSDRFDHMSPLSYLYQMSEAAQEWGIPTLAKEIPTLDEEISTFGGGNPPFGRRVENGGRMRERGASPVRSREEKPEPPCASGGSEAGGS
jgi:hypothetical protein